MTLRGALATCARDYSDTKWYAHSLGRTRSRYPLADGRKRRAHHAADVGRGPADTARPPSPPGRRAALTLGAAALGATGLLLWRDATSALLFLACAAVSLGLLTSVKRFAFRHGAIALPGGRDVHTLPTPLIGGAALYVPVACTLLVLGLLGDPRAWGLLIGGTIVFLSGLLDDLRGIPARLKILAQILAGCVLLASGFRLTALGVPGAGVLETQSVILSVGLLLGWVVIATNALNLSDGIDGLATSLSTFRMGVLAIADVGGAVPIALAGACLGVLHFNLPRARIFLGDAGSLLLGFLLAALTLEFPVRANVPLTIAVFAYPLGDVTLCICRRWLCGEPLFAADRSHVHHKALEFMGRPLRALLAVLAFAMLNATMLALWPGTTTLLLCALMWLTVWILLAHAVRYKPAEVLANRRPVRHLHNLQTYIASSLVLARSDRDVTLALRHLTEAEGIGSVSVDEPEIRPLALGSRPEEPAELAPSSVIHTRDGVVGWTALPSMRGGGVNLERELVMVTLLRQAHERLAILHSAEAALASTRRARKAPSVRPCVAAGTERATA